MLLLEHDAKAILAQRGLTVPQGVLTASATDSAPDFEAPWFVKAQIPAGGRGKAGGVIRVDDAKALSDVLGRLIGSRLKGHPVRECRIEEAVGGAREAYFSLSVEPRTGRINVLLSEAGGVEIESDQGRAGIVRESCSRDARAIRRCVENLTDPFGPPMQSALRAAGMRLADLFCELEATQIEINPLLVRDDGRWTVGDIKMVVDENAFVRQPIWVELIRRRADAYPEAALKLAQDFDYVELDPDGEIGLVTTGAGLSMQLIDELLEKGIQPLNFCDIRSGTFRGDPGRLIWVMRQIAEAGSVRAVLVNIFAGVTHLGELAGLLLQALDAVPELRAPIVVRLVGHGLEEAREILAASDAPLTLEVDLERAVERCVSLLAKHP